MLGSLLGSILYGRPEIANAHKRSLHTSLAKSACEDHWRLHHLDTGYWVPSPCTSRPIIWLLANCHKRPKPTINQQPHKKMLMLMLIHGLQMKQRQRNNVIQPSQNELDLMQPSATVLIVQARTPFKTRAASSHAFRSLFTCQGSSW